MNNNWPTREQDMFIAQRILEEYADANNINSLSVFEVVVNKNEKKMDFRLSSWVLFLAAHFQSLYGASQGDFVTRQILTRYIIKGETIH